MDLSLERDSSLLGSLFQHIINDMKNTSPLWEDFVAKAAKLHACLRAAIQAIAAYLDAFQKIADAATNSRGASKEIGTALTRVCLRHKAVETRLKTFTAAIMDCLVQPLQDKIEDWKRTVATIDKDHAKEYKRCRTELKKRSSDTLRLQKKARKGQSDTIQSLMDSHMQDVTLRRAELEEVEKKSLRAAMIEERLRYCTFVHMLQPVVKEECEVMSELGHLQEAMQSIANVTKDPSVLPAASEELIQDTKVSMSLYPESPVGGSGSQGACSNSLGSRKSSVCSISSMNSSGSSNSPGHHHYPRSLSQLISPAIRLKPGESSDSGFCSSPALTTQTSNATNQSHAAATWPPHSQDAAPLPSNAERPHTISTTYEKGHQRPPLTVYTFQNPETIHEVGSSPNGNNGSNTGTASGQTTPSTQKSPASTLSRPPLPVRCSSLERPIASSNNTNSNNRNGANLRHCPSPIPAHITKDSPTIIENDERSRASVLQKASMFEKQAAAVAASSTPSSGVVGARTSGDSGIYGTRRLDDQQHYRTGQQAQQDAGDQLDVGGGNGTRIPRRSSVNTAKPPPPVRRSSSVTPSHNASTGSNNQNEKQEQQQHQQQQQQQSTATHTNVSNLTQQNKQMMCNSTESLPPPPAYLLDGRQAQCTTSVSATQHTSIQNIENSTISTTATPPPTLMPNSALKVAETVKALSAMRHQPASPNALRRPQSQQQQPSPQHEQHHQHNQQQQQQHHQPSLQCSPNPTTPIQHNLAGTITMSTAATASASSSLLITKNEDEMDFAGFYNPYIEVNSSYALSATTKTTAAQHSTTLNAYCEKYHQRSSPPTYQMSRQLEEAQFYNKINYMTESSPTPPPSVHDRDDRYGQTATGQNNNNRNPYSQQNCFYSSQNHSQIHEFQQPFHLLQQRQQQQQQQQQSQQLQQHYHKQSHYQNSQQYQQQLQQQLKTDVIYGNNASFRTTSPGIYAQPKIATNMSSFRSTSPGPNWHHGHQTQAPHPLPPTQPKTNPNLIAQLNARLNSKQQQNIAGENIYGSSTNSPQHQRSLSAHADHSQHQHQRQSQQQQQQQHHHQQQSNEAIYARNFVQQQQQMSAPQHHQTPQMQVQMQHTYDAAAPNQQPQLQQQQQQQYHHPNVVARQQNYRENYVTPPPLENPPPPPVSGAYATATMPRNFSARNNAGHSLVAYAAATSFTHASTATMPKNYAQQQRLIQQQHQQDQQQKQYHQPTAISQVIYNSDTTSIQQQHQNILSNHQRPPMPLPHQQALQQQQQKTKAATLQHPQSKQPPVPSRHSSIQQKILVTTNPFIQTTAIHCHSPAAAQSSPGSPTCSSPSSVASIYSSHVRGGGGGGGGGGGAGSVSNYHPPQYHTPSSSAGIGGNANGVSGHYPIPNSSSGHHSNYIGTNIEKAGSIRSKTKAEFLENLNAKLAKQNISGRAFAVRSLINSKALPDPRVCHESLMDQIKRGATLKRNQKINDRSAPKIL